MQSSLNSPDRLLVQSSTSLEREFRDKHLSHFKELNDQQPGQWSLARGPNSLSLLDADPTLNDEHRGLRVELFGALPIPNVDVPLEEIIRFKEKRKAELISLRVCLERVYQSIMDAPDPLVAKNTEINALQQAIGEYSKIIEENKWTLRLIDLTASLKLDRLIDAATGAGIGLGLVDLGTAVSTRAMLKVSLSEAYKHRKSFASPYEYVVAARNELFNYVS